MILCVVMSKPNGALPGEEHDTELSKQAARNEGIWVPEKVWLEGETICWKMGAAARFREVSEELLDQFLHLTDGKSILQFAKNWGVLRLAGKKRLRPGRIEMKAGREPVAAWQYYVRRAAAVLNVAAALKQNKLGDLSDWGEFAMPVGEGGLTSENLRALEATISRLNFGMGYSLFVQPAGREGALERARDAVASEVRGWMDCWKQEQDGELSDLVLRWNVAHQRWELQVDYHGLLFAAIALQLGMAVADAECLYSCSGCGMPYIRARERKRPKSGWANYCDRCDQGGVSKRRAVESYREKKATAKRLHLSGVPVEQIAEQLNTKVERVRGWIT